MRSINDKSRLGRKVDSTHADAFGPDKSTDAFALSFAGALRLGQDKENANPNTSNPSSDAFKPSMSPSKPAATGKKSFADALKLGQDKENANPNTGKPSSNAFKPSMSPRKPAATEMEEKSQSPRKPAVTKSPSRIAGQKPGSDGFYPFTNGHRGADGFFSPQKEKDGIVYYSQSSIDGPSAVELAHLLQDGWALQPNGNFQDPVNLVIFKDGSIVSFDHRRCWAAAQNSLRVPFILHEAKDVFVNPTTNKSYTINDEPGGHKRRKTWEDKEPGRKRFKTWGEAILERCNHDKNEKGFKGRKKLPILRNMKRASYALRREHEHTNDPYGRKITQIR